MIPKVVASGRSEGREILLDKLLIRSGGEENVCR